MRVFIIAGEPSGDKLGAALMEGLQALVPEVEFDGIGGARMSEAGLKSRFPMEEISIMGISEILSQYRHLKTRIAQTADQVVQTQPDVLITIDLPEFSLRVAKLVKAKSQVRCVHYVAPTVWAWRAGRAAKMARHIDQVLALFPFEPPYMEAAGMRCDFVGHPVVMDPQATQDQANAFREAHRIEPLAPLALVLPGSRRGEVSRLAPIFGKALEPVLEAHPNLKVVIPAAAPVEELVRNSVADWSVAPLIIRSEDKALKRAAFKAANVALAASGTVSLELAAVGTPMVIAYDMNWLSRQVIGRMLKVDTVTLVNLVSDTRAVPEFIGADCVPERIATGLLDVFDDPSRQAAAMQMTMQRLGQDGEAPGVRAAKAVLSGLSQNASHH
ncbi:lipid-A-disaccharide synthase [Planktotalea sp.]|uniref:lipid-A-disaccharide synthase n=1 Tax=Planktotalea sp. TaxID=2029877 RepID=UPI003F6CDEF9